MHNRRPTPQIPRLRSFSRRRFLFGLGGGTLAVGGLGHAAWYEPTHPVIERVTIPVAKLPPPFDGFRIALLSDLHVQPAFPAERLLPAVELVRQERPDLIALLGDYVNGMEHDNLGHMEACARAIGSLSAPYGVFAIFGNHDFPAPPADPPETLWRDVGIEPLLESTAEVKRFGASIFLVGLRSSISRPVVPQWGLERAPSDAVRILLWHEPDGAPVAAAAGASLQFSGHTHGGQVILPFIGPPLLPVGGRRYPSGLYRVGGMPLYVTRGVGLLPPMLRINCPPEVTIVTLRPA
jgi:predicted MPP superfamily phosphohydrolase